MNKIWKREGNGVSFKDFCIQYNEAKNRPKGFKNLVTDASSTNNAAPTPVQSSDMKHNILLAGFGAMVGVVVVLAIRKYAK